MPQKSPEVRTGDECVRKGMFTVQQQHALPEAKLCSKQGDNEVQQELDCVLQVHEQHPDNKEALKFLVQLAGELQDEAKRVMYETALTKVERVLAMQEHVPRPTSRQVAGGANSFLPLHGNTSGGFEGDQSGLACDDLLPDPAMMQRMSSKVSQAEDITSPVDMIGVGLLPGLD